MHQNEKLGSGWSRMPAFAIVPCCLTNSCWGWGHTRSGPRSRCDTMSHREFDDVPVLERRTGCSSCVSAFVKMQRYDECDPRHWAGYNAKINQRRSVIEGNIAASAAHSDAKSYWGRHKRRPPDSSLSH